MISIPLYFFLLIYAAYLIIFFIFALINVAHLSHTGALTFTSFAVTVIVGALITLVFWATYFLLQAVDWSTLLTVWNMDWITNIFVLN